MITPDDEDKMWEDGALRFSPQKILQHTVFFYMGLHLLLRGVQVQHMLVPAQLVCEPRDTAVYHSAVYYRYSFFPKITNIGSKIIILKTKLFVPLLNRIHLDVW